jgi:hypothetical protein
MLDHRTVRALPTGPAPTLTELAEQLAAEVAALDAAAARWSALEREAAVTCAALSRLTLVAHAAGVEVPGALVGSTFRWSLSLVRDGLVLFPSRRPRWRDELERVARLVRWGR